MKKIGLCLGFVFASALAVVACGGTKGGDMLGGGGGDGGGQQGGGGGDGGSFACVTAPMTGDDFLNSCAPASVQKVDIMPFYPTLAPNGVLPPLQ